MKAITLNALSLHFGSKIILEKFSGAVEPGEFIGIFGPNGAGKSTLFKIILGLQKPDQGDVLVFNKPVKKGNPHIGYLPQIRQAAPTHQLTGRTYIGATLDGFHWGIPFINRRKKALIEEVIQLTELQEIIDRPYRYLSGGERQRIALAEALLNQPPLLLLDEPLSGLDPGQQEKMIQLIKSIQQRLNITILFTAHDMNPLIGVMDRLIYLAKGKAIIGSVDEAINSEQLSLLYDAPIEVIQQKNHLIVIHKKSGIYLHDLDHPSC